MPSSADTVTTPLPPIPASSMLYTSPMRGSTGSGSAATKAASSLPSSARARTLPPVTVTKLGHSPLAQEKSVLQTI
jgi:hypothetical protein